jgi:hypothetical protein
VTQPQTRYRLAIATRNFPEALAGAPLPVEIIPEKGRARRIVVTLSGDQTLEDVAEPGRYLVRATLPSGYCTAQVATVVDEPDAQGTAVGAAALDFSGESAEPVLAARKAGKSEASRAGRGQGRGTSTDGFKAVVRRGFNSLGALTGFGIAPPSDFEGVESSTAASDTAPAAEDAAAVSYVWGVFERWKPAPAGGSTPGGMSASGMTASGATLLVQRRGSGVVDPRGRIVPPAGDGRMVLIEVALPPPEGEVLIAWLPDASRRPARLLHDSDRGPQLGGPPLLVSYNGGHPIVDALFSYVRNGALNDARAAVPVLIDHLQHDTKALRGVPDQLVRAAYVLYKLSIREAEPLIDGLVAQGPTLPDMLILQGSRLIGQGKAADAAQYFDRALAQGVPIHTEFVRMLRDGLNFLKGLYPDDTIRCNAERANCLATAANFTSELTCLRLGREITVEIVDAAEVAGGTWRPDWAGG